MNKSVIDNFIAVNMFNIDQGVLGKFHYANVDKRFEKFKDDACQRFGDKFDYSKVDYINSTTNVTIICKDHGEFNITPESHLSSAHGCPNCERQSKKIADDTLKLTKIISRCREKFNNKFGYDLIEHFDESKFVTILCPIHGRFNAKLHLHLKSKHGCPNCASEFVDENRKQKRNVFNEFKIS
jgi:hypothetical protein